MLCSQMQVLVVALCSSVLVVHVGAAPQITELTQALQEDFISKKDLTDLLLLRFVSELMASGGEELHQELEEDEFGGGRERLTRRHIRFAHRAPKAGCRNFFWKSFTSC